MGGSGSGTGTEALNEATPKEAGSTEPLPVATASGMLIEVDRNAKRRIMLLPV